MQAWAIVTIIIMIIVFFAILGLYYLIYRYCTRRFEDRVASSSTLHYWDFYHSHRTLNIPNNGEPVDERSVIQRIAADMCELYERTDVNEDNVILARYDRANQTYVALDLDVFLSVKHRPQFLKQTASQPLALLHHSPHTTGVGNDEFSSLEHAPEPDQNRPQVTSASKRWERRRKESKHQSHATAEPPRPQFHPASTLITTEMDITVTANCFSYVDAPAEAIPPHVLRMIEASVNKTTKTIFKDGETTVVVDPADVNSLGQRGLILVRNGSELRAREVGRWTPGSLRFCKGGDVFEQWTPYTGPFRLPVGRWCVRAESCSIDGRQIKSESKVYSVEEGNSGMV